MDFEPKSIAVGDCLVVPISVMFSWAATFIAFIIESPNKSSKINLVNMNTPINSKIALLDSNNDVHYPLDENFDGTNFKGQKRVGIISFDPFQNPCSRFKIIFISDKEEYITVTGNEMENSIKHGLETPNFVETIETSIEENIEGEIELKIGATNSKSHKHLKHRPSGGCLSIFLVGLIIFLILM